MCADAHDTAMTDDNSTQRIAAVPLSRRQALSGLVAVAAGGIGMTQLRDNGVQAQVSVSEFAVADSQFAGAVEPVLDATLEWAYDVESSVGSVGVELLVGDETLASERLQTNTQSASATTELSARLTDHSRYSAADFEAGETDVSVGAYFMVQDDGGNAIVETTAQDSATISVTEASAEVGGSVEISRADE